MSYLLVALIVAVLSGVPWLYAGLNKHWKFWVAGLVLFYFIGWSMFMHTIMVEPYKPFTDFPVANMIIISFLFNSALSFAIVDNKALNPDAAVRRPGRKEMHKRCWVVMGIAALIMALLRRIG